MGQALEKAAADRWIASILKEADYACKEVTLDVEKACRDGDFCKGKPYENPYFNHGLRIAIVIYSFIMGGGEIFPIHLANALKKRGTAVTLICCDLEKPDKKVRGMVDQEVPIISLCGYKGLPRLLQSGRFDIVHTHHAVIDTVVSEIITRMHLQICHVITLHGMYEALSLYRGQKLARLSSRSCQGYAYIADKNLEPFRFLNEDNTDAEEQNRPRFTRIPNGLPKKCPEPVSRSELRIPEKAFVLALVSRALYEKGWEEAIRSVQMANRFSIREIHLVLVGGGEAFDKLRNIADPRIHFTGPQQEPRRYFAMADMGFLPSTYKGESFPLVIIDSLMCGKPVLASNVGEIESMLRTDSGIAGIVFDLENGKVPVNQVAKTIVRVANSEMLYQELQKRTVEAASRHNISHTADKYLTFYAECMNPSSVSGKNIRESASMQKSETAFPKTCMPKERKIRILVSCHKESRVIRSKIIRPIQLGCALTDQRFPNMYRDNFGENISADNEMYCELTAQYWAWKNLKADYFGFFHYRRYLNLSSQVFREDKYGNVYEPSLGRDDGKKLEGQYGLTDSRIRELTEQYDILTVKARDLKDADGRPLSVREHFYRAPHLRGADLKKMEIILKEKEPDFIKAAEKYLNGNRAYFCNLYLMRAELFDAYCQWLFPLLDEFCRRTDFSEYDREELRTPGHLAERLWGIYLTKLQEEESLKIQECQCVVISHTEEMLPVEKVLPVDEVRRTWKRVAGVIDSCGKWL